MYQPLADRIRPQTLDDVVGQTELLRPDGILRRVIENGQIPNMIFYGPSGVGKTTVASIIAKQTERKLYRLNATTAAIADIRRIIDELRHNILTSQKVLYTTHKVRPEVTVRNLIEAIVSDSDMADMLNL